MVRSAARRGGAVRGAAATSATQNLGGDAFAAVLRWNGTAWNVAPAPPLGTLTSVTALSPGNVWVSGTDGEGPPGAANSPPKPA